MYVYLTLVVIENNHIIDDYKQHNICIVTIINNHIQLWIVSHTHHNNCQLRQRLISWIVLLFIVIILSSVYYKPRPVDFNNTGRTRVSVSAPIQKLNTNTNT